MLEDEGSHRVGMALGADGELAGGGAHLVANLASMRIVAIAALDQPNVYAMPEGSSELGFLRSVAAIAELSLRLHQHEVHVGGFVGAVTGSATDPVGHMSRLREVLRFQARLVAFRADGGGLGRCQSLKPDDLGDIPTAVNMRLARPMTTLAAVLIALQQG